MAVFAPLLIASLVLQGASFAANRAAEKKVESARRNVRLREEERQDEFTQENRTRFQELLNKQNREEIEAAQAGESDRLQQRSFERIERPEDPASLLPGNAGASDAARAELVNNVSGATAGAERDAVSQALVQAIGNAEFLNNINIKGVADRTQTTGNLARSSAGVVPVELEGANQKGNGLSNLAGLLSGLSSVAGTASGVVGGGAGVPIPSRKPPVPAGFFA